MSEQVPNLIKKINLSEQDRRLIQIIRHMKSEELRIIVEKGSPVRVEVIQRDIQL